MTLSDLLPSFQGHDILDNEYLRNDTRLLWGLGFLVSTHVMYIYT